MDPDGDTVMGGVNAISTTSLRWNQDFCLGSPASKAISLSPGSATVVVAVPRATPAHTRRPSPLMSANNASQVSTANVAMQTRLIDGPNANIGTFNWRPRSLAHAAPMSAPSWQIREMLSLSQGDFFSGTVGAN
ncbi:hypothetical protein E4U34_001815 [Claviceps purpurea]|nr:hypothetical protein E4U34_001815 [Claviceps purpurea]